MFHELEKQETILKDEVVSAFVEMYERLVKGARWNAEQKAAGADISLDLIRYRKMELKVDNIWQKLPEDKRAIAVNILSDKGYMPAGWKEVVAKVKGRVAKIT